MDSANNQPQTSNEDQKKNKTGSIDPLHLLKCLDKLLNLSGGIKNVQCVQRILGLMGKYSRKLVSKCVYLNILSATDSDILEMFYDAGGWMMVADWLIYSIHKQNWPLVEVILDLLNISPITLDRLQLDALIMVKEVKYISGACPCKKVQNMAHLLILDWTRMLQAKTSAESTQVSDTNSESNSTEPHTDPPNASTSNGTDGEKAESSSEKPPVVSEPVAEAPVKAPKGRGRPKSTNTLKKSKLKTYPSRAKTFTVVSRSIENDPRTKVINHTAPVLVSTPVPEAIIEQVKASGKSLVQNTGARGRKRKVAQNNLDSGDSERSESPIKPLKITIRNGKQVLSETKLTTKISLVKSEADEKIVEEKVNVIADVEAPEAVKKAPESVTKAPETTEKPPQLPSPKIVKNEDEDSDEDFVVTFKNKKERKSSPLKPARKKIRSIIVSSEDESDDSLPDITPGAVAKKKVKLETKEKPSAAPLAIKLKEVRKEDFKKIVRSDSVTSDGEKKVKTDSDSDRKKSRSDDKHRNDKHRSEKNKEYERKKEKERDRDRKTSDKERKHSSSSSSSSRDKYKEKDRISSRDNDKKKDRRELSDKDRLKLEKTIKPMSTDGMAKIPKKPASFLDALGAADSVSTGESQLRKPPIKMKSHGFRSTGLLDAVAKPSAPGVAGKRTIATAPIVVKQGDKYGIKRDGVDAKRPLEEPVASGEKRFKSTISSVPLSGDRPGGVKLISPKRPSLSDDGGFMAALDAISKQTTETRKVKTKKRRNSSDGKGDGKGAESGEAPREGEDGEEPNVFKEEEEPAKEKELEEPKPVVENLDVMTSTPMIRPPLNFYKDTLADIGNSPDEKKTEDSKEKEEQNKETKEEQPKEEIEKEEEGDKDAKTETEDKTEVPMEVAESAPPAENYEKVEVMETEPPSTGVKSALVIVRKAGPKKSVCFKPDSCLETMHYFELDSTERVNVNSQKFQDMQLQERIGERDVFTKQHGKGGNHTQYGPWKLLPIHLPDTVTQVVSGYKSQERHIQAKREYSAIATFFHPDRLPDTPIEAEPELFSRTEPKIFPLNDTSGTVDSVKNLKNVPWPAPILGEAPPSQGPAFPPQYGFDYPPGHAMGHMPINDGYYGAPITAAPGHWVVGNNGPAVGPPKPGVEPHGFNATTGMVPAHGYNPINNMGPGRPPMGPHMGSGPPVVGPPIRGPPGGFPMDGPPPPNQWGGYRDNGWHPPRGGGRGRGRGGWNRGGGGSTTCRYFSNLGHCRNGDDCKFVHARH